MPANSDITRLVYPPKAWAFVKNAKEEVLDISDYIVGGSVRRRINQPSSAELKLRNPEMIFTARGDKKAAFHPMDPITIYLSRFPGHHVQVFTGYLDEATYLQLLPGIITLKATCTLKKLIYNYFQLGQAYTLAFFEHFGWKPTGTGALAPVQGGKIQGAQQEALISKWEAEFKEGKITEAERNKKKDEIETENRKTAEATERNQGKLTKGIATPFQDPSSPFTGVPAIIGNDGSFRKLLWATLYYMADWRDENIYIEAMPPTVPKLITTLWTDFNEAEHEAQEAQLESFWAAIIGAGSEGSGGGPGNGSSVGKTGNIADPGKATNLMAKIAHEFGIPPEFVVATALCETGFNQSEIKGTNTANATGWFQFTSSEPYPGIKVNYPEDARDTALATTAFSKAAKAQLAKNNSYSQEGNWEKWAEETQKPGTGAYASNWVSNVKLAREMITKYSKTAGLENELQPKGKVEEELKGKTKAGGGTTGKGKTRLQVMEAEAKEITSKQYPYSWGGGHEHAGTPSIGKAGGPAGSSGVLGYDCAGSVGAVLAAGGFIPLGGPIPSSGEFSSLKGAGWEGGAAPGGKGISIFYNAEHAWMTINGQYFSTSGANPGGGAGFRPGNDGLNPGDFTAMHLSPHALEEEYTGAAPPKQPGEGTSKEGEAEGGIGSSEGMSSLATAASFLSQIAYPTAAERELALLIGGERSLINTTPVINLVEQIATSSLRSFMSLPNGDFYGFFPDYFGEFNHRKPYWQIHNIEIMEGQINLTDDNLVTHYFAVGDVTWPQSIPLTNELNSGAMTIFEAFAPGILLHDEQRQKAEQEEAPGLSTQISKTEAVKFLQRYGARPVSEDFPMVYSTVFEQLIAYQRFLLGWSRQFQSEFKFTFMPELFPGGKVAFPEHGLQMFVEEVVHEWNLETGFTTSALLTAPSVYRTSENEEAVEELPEFMVEALLEPQRGEVSPHPTAPKIQPPSHQHKESQKGRQLHNQSFGPGPEEQAVPIAPNPFISPLP